MMKKLKPEACLALLLALPAALSAQQDAAVFDAPVVMFPSTTSMDMLADFNGDGNTDAAGWWWYTTRQNQAQVVGYHGDGKGGFVGAFSFFASVPAGPTSSWAMAPGRFNRDLRDDFVLAFDTEVSVYLLAQVSPPPLYASLKVPFPVRAAAALDFDRDGLDDLVVAGLEVLLYRNTGAGFGLVSRYPAATGTLFVREMNGDGHPDLVLPAGDAILLLSTTGGKLGMIASYPHGVPAVQQPLVVSGDIDGDKDDDVVVFASVTGEYVTLERTGAATLTLRPRKKGGPATGLADIDGDGILDGVCCGGGGPSTKHNSSTSVFHLSINDGKGNFAPAWLIHGVGGKRLAGAADLDGDGDLDLVAGRTVFYNQRTFHRDPTPYVSVGLPLRVAGADFDGDGDADAIADSLYVWKNDGSGDLDPNATALPASKPGTYYRGPGFHGDFDGDGDSDVIVGHVAGTTTLGARLMRNVAGIYQDAGYAAPPPTGMHPDNESSSFGTSSMTADIDGDGDIDVLAGGRRSWGTVKVWLNDGSGRFTAGPDLWAFSPLAATDVDHDGRIDLVVSMGAGVRVYYGKGGGAFEAPVDLVSSVALHDRVAVADLDGDRLPDIGVLDNRSNQRLHIWINDGKRGFTLRTEYAAALRSNNNRAAYVDAMDVDGDGDQDLVLGPATLEDGCSWIWINDGRASFPTKTIQVLEPHGFADVDGDGDLDAIGVRVVRGARFVTPHCGWRQQYGTGTPGLGGFAPILGATGPFRAGETGNLLLDGAPGDALAALVVGTERVLVAGWPAPGMSLYTIPAAVVLARTSGTAIPGEGRLNLKFTIPVSAENVGFYSQVFVADQAAAYGLTQTNGLHLRVGR